MDQQYGLELLRENQRMKELLKIGFCDKCGKLGCDACDVSKCSVAEFVKPKPKEVPDER
jgi:hypothetical protein